MKKAYIKPTTLSYNVETEQLLNSMSLNATGASVDACAKEYGGDGGSSFDFDLWADDEE